MRCWFFKIPYVLTRANARSTCIRRLACSAVSIAASGVCGFLPRLRFGGWMTLHPIESMRASMLKPLSAAIASPGSSTSITPLTSVSFWSVMRPGYAELQ